MILLAFTAFFAMDISLEIFKEINLNDELLFQPRLSEKSVFLFFEKEVLKLNLEDFSIENFFEGDTYNIYKNEIVLEKNGKRLKVQLQKSEENNLLDSYDFKIKAKKIFYDPDLFYIQTEDNFFHCIRKIDLKRLWKVKIPSEVIALNSDQKRVYILCGSDIILALKRKGGDIIWWKSIKLRCFPETGLLDGNILIFNREGINFLNSKNGAMIKKIDFPMNFAPILSGEYLILFKRSKVLVYKIKR